MLERKHAPRRSEPPARVQPPGRRLSGGDLQPQGGSGMGSAQPAQEGIEELSAHRPTPPGGVDPHRDHVPAVAEPHDAPEPDQTGGRLRDIEGRLVRSRPARGPQDPGARRKGALMGEGRSERERALGERPEPELPIGRPLFCPGAPNVDSSRRRARLASSARGGTRPECATRQRFPLPRTDLSERGEVTSKEVEDPRPGVGGRLRVVVRRSGVVEEGVTGARVDVVLEGTAGGPHGLR